MCESVWEGVGDRRELQHIDLHSYDHQCCGFLVRQGCSTGGLGAQLSDECWLSIPHLDSNFWSPKLTDFLSSPSYIIVQSPTQSLEWHVWSSSSGNNCHAVLRSLPSGAPVWLYRGILPCPILSAKPAYANGICHFRVFGMAYLAGSKDNIQQNSFSTLKLISSRHKLYEYVKKYIFFCMHRCVYTYSTNSN